MKIRSHQGITHRAGRDLTPSCNRSHFGGSALKSFSLAALFLATLLTISSKSENLPEDLADQFRSPPPQAEPWVFWMWLHADTTHAAMTRDLEQMKAKGIAGFILYDTHPGRLPAGAPGSAPMASDYRFKTVLVGKEFHYVNPQDYKGAYETSIQSEPIAAWTPHWRDLIRYVARESVRLGLKFCLTVGRSDTSGNIPDEYGNQQLIWSETRATGPSMFNGILPKAPWVPRGKGANQAPRPQYRREVSVLAFPSAAGFSASQVVDVSSRMDATGRLQWDVPPGKWQILRFEQVPTGARNDWGYFTDGLSAEAVDKVWDVTMAPLLREMSPEERKGLIGVEEDSWEGGVDTWTRTFPEQFRKLRGYDLTPYLPILAGAKMADDVTRRQVQRDYDLTIADLMADCHYRHLEQLCRQNGLTFFSEAAGPNLTQSDLLKNISRVDVPMAEFWYPCAHRPQPKDRFFARAAACATHVYGMPSLNMDEAFTSMGPEWEETPFTMKPVGDQAFCDGVNRICFHNFSHSPSLTAKPGYVYLAGTHYEPGVTWWDETPAFNSYLARCSTLLQDGRFMADALFYDGDNIGMGEPMKIIHPTLGEGYDHDNCNTEVLLTRASVRDGRLVLKGGMSYGVLILPDHQAMAPEALEKIASLLEAGATVVGPPPTGLADLPLVPGEQSKFDALIARLWGNEHPEGRIVDRRIGAGRLVSGLSARHVLQDEGIAPDFEETGLSPFGAMDWIHREAGDAEIYFVASRWEHPEKVECAFRVVGKQPELWDPVTGEMRDATAFRQENGRTFIPLEFGPCGSIFAVFRRPISASQSGKTSSNYASTHLLNAISGPWTVHFDPKWGGPDRVVFEALVDWTNRPEPGIKYYSGTAVYHKKFDLPSPLASGRRLLLDLGEVHEVASVRLNGRNLGALWTKPARVDITGAVLAKDNDLEVSVVNLWQNRLIADELLPEQKRLTKTNCHKFGPSTPLLPSGLLGPVRLLIQEPTD